MYMYMYMYIVRVLLHDTSPKGALLAVTVAYSIHVGLTYTMYMYMYSTCTVAVNKNFTFRLRTTVVAQCERFRENDVLAIVSFYMKRQFRSVFTISIPFHDRSPSEGRKRSRHSSRCS